jgi:peptidoglycan hydrolase-like protein with peptidoglycan-binding domain
MKAISPLLRRQRVLLIVATVAAFGSTAGLIVSTAIRSPAQVAADTQPPHPSVLTAEVTRKVLASTVVARGAFTRGRPYEFTPTSSAATTNGPGGSVLVVTAVHTSPGATVRAGAVLLEVSERPIFALPGAFPAYRNMVPGQTGKDIAQLQAGLSSLGYRSSDRKGYFGTGTAEAVRRFYTARGYRVPLADPAAAAASASASASASATPNPGGEPSVGASPSTTATASPEATTDAPFRVAVAPDPLVPMSEVVFLPTLPARVAAFSARVGDSVAAPLVSFSTDGLTLTAQLDPVNLPLLRTGMEVSVLAEASGYTSTGTVHTIGARVNDASGRAFIPVTIAREGDWPSELEGQDVRTTITTAATTGEVLAVPLAAISSTADGRTTVSVVAADASRRLVEVSVGASADGWVEVTPVGGDSAADALRPGDTVVTGT